MADLTDEELLEELGVEIEAPSAAARSPRDERLIAGFEDIQRFVETHGRAPEHGETRDIFERMYAVRLDRLRALPEARALLAPFDHQGLLAAAADAPPPADDEELLRALGVDPEASDGVTALKHVRPAAEKRAAEEIANRTRCANFAAFKPLFDAVQRDLDLGVRMTRPFERKAEIEAGRFFIVGGQKAYIADLGEPFINDSGNRDSRMRVIFDNGTESNILMRSLQKALTQDEAGRRITDPNAGPLFADAAGDGDIESGTIYVLRSLSDHPVVAASRDVVHKIGVTGGEVEARIAGARQDPTFLFADVEIVATYDLFNINRAKLESLLHKFFAAARLDLEIEDRFGRPVRPQEWYLVPFNVIDQVVTAIQDGSISGLRYDPASASLRARSV